MQSVITVSGEVLSLQGDQTYLTPGDTDPVISVSVKVASLWGTPTAEAGSDKVEILEVM